MWFNSTQREEPYQPLTCPVWGGEIRSFSSAGGNTGAAWLSSARVVRCWVKSRNERNPHPMLPAGKAGNSWETAGVTRRKVRMTSSQHGPYILGYKHATMDGTQRKPRGRPGGNPTNPFSVRIAGCNSPA